MFPLWESIACFPLWELCQRTIQLCHSGRPRQPALAGWLSQRSGVVSGRRHDHGLRLLGHLRPNSGLRSGLPVCGNMRKTVRRVESTTLKGRNWLKSVRVRYRLEVFDSLASIFAGLASFQEADNWTTWFARSITFCICCWSVRISTIPDLVVSTV